MSESKVFTIPALQIGKTAALRGLAPTQVLLEHFQFLQQLETAEQTAARIAIPPRFFVRDGDSFQEVDPAERQPLKCIEWIRDDERK